MQVKKAAFIAPIPRSTRVPIRKDTAKELQEYRHRNETPLILEYESKTQTECTKPLEVIFLPCIHTQTAGNLMGGDYTLHLLAICYVAMREHLHCAQNGANRIL